MSCVARSIATKIKELIHPILPVLIILQDSIFPVMNSAVFIAFLVVIIKFKRSTLKMYDFDINYLLYVIDNKIRYNNLDNNNL